jgi:pyrimidine operon attenuation protein/uracil phosphoribosyltransferase
MIHYRFPIGRFGFAIISPVLFGMRKFGVFVCSYRLTRIHTRRGIGIRLGFFSIYLWRDRYDQTK